MSRGVTLWIDVAAAAAGAPALFGLPPIERLRRSAGRSTGGAGVTLSGPAADAAVWPGARVDADAAPLGSRLRRALGEAGAAGTAWVAVDAADAVDPRLIAFLLRRPGPCLAARGTGAARAVALRLDAGLAASIPPDAANLGAVADALLAAGGIALLDEAEFPGYVDKLRRTLPYWLHAVGDRAARRRLERQMFWDNYKGSTDLLTRWIYPPLVWPLTLAATRWRVHPNVLTVASIVLAFAAVPLFAAGDWVAGFACAYAMSVLDSVDGKVARLTLTDSKIGNVLDHGLDQVHPPFWYFAWAWGLGARTAADAPYRAALWLIGLYLADRIVLGIARHRLGFGLHAATPLDGRVRSFIARRNMTMSLMAGALLFGAGPLGLWLVTAWQGLTVAWHGVRTLQLGFLSPRPAPGAPAPEPR